MTSQPLLDREDFCISVFDRDGFRCVVCDGAAADAHHLIERKLFEDGGYYLDNGVTLCSPCHLKAEMTELTPAHLRSLAGISTVVLPPGFSTSCQYDKWGNEYLPNGMRSKGPMFELENVQKVLKRTGVLSEFTDHIKYPRSLHLPWSPGATSDDKMLENISHFVGREVVVTEKLDGENTTMYSNHIHARSLSEARGEDRAHVKALWGRVRYDIPEGWRVCGENMAAMHSIRYTDLPAWLMVFSVWNERNEALSWDDTVEWCDLLSLTTVPVLYRGLWDEDLIRGLHQSEVDGQQREGYVVRVTDSFNYADFGVSLAKMVRENHVTTDTHWKFQKRTWNQVKSSS